MRTPVNFRLSSSTVLLLDRLAAQSGEQKTRIVEKAISSYSIAKHKNPLLKFAGILSDDDAVLLSKVTRRNGGSKPVVKL